VTFFTTFAPSVEYRCNALPGLLAAHGSLGRLDETEAALLWQEAMTGSALTGQALWRVHLLPRRAPELVARFGDQWAMDWGGGQVWIALDDTGTAPREAAATLGGEAVLSRAPPEMRSHVPAFHPRVPGVAALESRVARAFDPHGIFATPRFREDAHADQLPA